MPAAERSVTYGQAMDYVRLHAEFMSDEEKSLFFGGNAARLFGLEWTAEFRDQAWRCPLQ